MLGVCGNRLKALIGSLGGKDTGDGCEEANYCVVQEITCTANPLKAQQQSYATQVNVSKGVLPESLRSLVRTSCPCPSSSQIVYPRMHVKMPTSQTHTDVCTIHARYLNSTLARPRARNDNTNCIRKVCAEVCPGNISSRQSIWCPDRQIQTMCMHEER